MKEYLSPWEQSIIPNGVHYYKRFVMNDGSYYSVASIDNKWTCYGDCKYYNTAEEAMKAYDIILISKGLILLTEEQVKVYKLLV